jgi:hypothetical protein
VAYLAGERLFETGKFDVSHVEVTLGSEPDMTEKGSL